MTRTINIFKVFVVKKTIIRGNTTEFGGDVFMLILGINRILNWLQITTGGRSYTCPTKEINGELFFKFKK